MARSGLSYFTCNHPNSMSRIITRYSSYEARNDEEPMVESGPSEHTAKSGVIHPPDIGKGMKEVAKHKIIMIITIII